MCIMPRLTLMTIGMSDEKVIGRSRSPPRGLKMETDRRAATASEPRCARRAFTKIAGTDDKKLIISPTGLAVRRRRTISRSCSLGVRGKA